ncbi:hypothetical protein Tco_1236371 [Tanacetum coccineum]
MSCLLDDIMESVISCETAKVTWTDLVYSFEGPSDTKENRIMFLKLEYQTFRAKPTESLSQIYTRYETFLNELANDGVNLSKHEINGGFVKSLLEKCTAISTAFFSNNVIQDFQENSDDEVDERSMSKGFQPKFTPKLIQSSQKSISQTNPKIQKDYKAEYKKMKAKLTLLEANRSTSQTPKNFQPKNKGLVAETFDWDEEEVLDDEEVTHVKVPMALADDELTIGKNHALNGEWIDITMRKHGLILRLPRTALLYFFPTKAVSHYPPWSSSPPQIPFPLPPPIPSPSLPLSPPSPVLSAPPPSPIRSLGYRAAMIRMRAEAAATSHSLPLPPPFILSPTRPDAPPPLPTSAPTSLPPLLLPSASRREDRPEVNLPPRKRLGIALGPRYEVGESSAAAAARPAGGLRADYGFVATMDREIRRDPERYVGYGITDSVEIGRLLRPYRELQLVLTQSWVHT